MDNQHITQQVRQDTLDMLILAGYNLHKDSWTPPPSACSASGTPRKDAGSALPSRAPSAFSRPQQGAGQVHGATATVSPAEVVAGREEAGLADIDLPVPHTGAKEAELLQQRS